MNMNKIIEDLEYIYPAIGIPMYLYQDGQILRTFPEQDTQLYPPEKYHNALWTSNLFSAILSTSFFAYYGILRLNSKNNFYLILGPVTPVRYSKNSLITLFKEFAISDIQSKSVLSFLDGIPNLMFTTFTSILTMLHHFLNGNNNITIGYLTKFPSEDELKSPFTNEIFNDKEYSMPNNSLEIERIVSKIVESGDIEQLKKGIAYPRINVGTLSPNPLRHMKNLFIVNITLLTRSAMKGGLNSSEAYILSDLYIQKAEEAVNLDQVNHLFYDAIATFTTLVSQVKGVAPKSSDMINIINYVRQHTNCNLTVADIANHFGYSNNYLSTKFKKELGFHLSSFIVHTKLEEAKMLLKYTDKSLLEISEYLCFCSQSHFQNCFKKQYGVTPLQYRTDISKQET